MSEVRSELLEVLASLVDVPEQLVLTESEEDSETVLFKLVAPPDEVGRVIGREGRTVRALRTLLDVRGSESGLYYDLEVLEGQNSPDTGDEEE